jgi:hypothetical protein
MIKDKNEDEQQQQQRRAIVLSFDPASSSYTVKMEEASETVEHVNVDPSCVTPCVVFRGAGRRSFCLRPLLKYLE